MAFISPPRLGVHFSHLRGLFPVPVLSLYQQPIPFQTEAHFLGLIFDSKLSFIPHIRHLRKSCFQALNVLCILASTFWGADCAPLLQIYRAVCAPSLSMAPLFMALPDFRLSSIWILCKIKAFACALVLFRPLLLLV